MQDLSAVFGMGHFRVKLHPVEPSPVIRHGSTGTLVGRSNALKTQRQFRNRIPMAHPADAFLRQILKQQAAGCFQYGLSVFSRLPGGRDPAAGKIRQQLVSVADPQDRDPQFQDSRVIAWSSRFVHASRAAGEDDATVSFLPDLRQTDPVIIPDLCIDILFPDTAGDQLVILPAEIQYQYLIHLIPRFLRSWTAPWQKDRRHCILPSLCWASRNR